MVLKRAETLLFSQLRCGHVNRRDGTFFLQMIKEKMTAIIAESKPAWNIDSSQNAVDLRHPQSEVLQNERLQELQRVRFTLSHLYFRDNTYFAKRKQSNVSAAF